MSDINYTGNWALDISDMSKEEWDQLVSILESKGVKVFNTTYDMFYTRVEDFGYLYCSSGSGKLFRECGAPWDRKPVSVLQMLNLLETPVKSPTQLKIEELQETIKQASIQINELELLEGE